MARGAGLAAALAPACAARPVRLAAGFALGWEAAFPLALGAVTDFFGGTKSLGIATQHTHTTPLEREHDRVHTGD